MQPNDRSLAQTRKLRIRRYLELHQALARKYGTAENHFSHKKVSFIRESVFRFGLNKRQTMMRVEGFMYRPGNKRRHRIEWYFHLYKFLKNCPDTVWEEITGSTTE